MRNLIRIIIPLLFAALFLHGVVKGLRRGYLRPSIHDRIYYRAREPLTFWFHILVYAVVALAMVAFASHSLLRRLH